MLVEQKSKFALTKHIILTSRASYGVSQQCVPCVSHNILCPCHLSRLSLKQKCLHFDETFKHENGVFWKNFIHWLRPKLSFWQLLVRPMIKVSSKDAIFVSAVVSFYGVACTRVVRHPTPPSHKPTFSIAFFYYKLIITHAHVTRVSCNRARSCPL